MTDLTKEQDILIVMRKVLASIIKDTTPPAGMKRPLTDQTIQDVRQLPGSDCRTGAGIGGRAGTGGGETLFHR